MNILLILLTVATILQIFKVSVKFNQKDRKNIFVSVIIYIITIVLCLYIAKLNTENKTNLYITIISIIDIIYVYITSNVTIHKAIKQREITQISIKEAIDLSEIGILHLNSTGNIILQNITMKNLLEQLKITNNYEEQIKNKSIKKTGNEYFVSIKEKIWSFEFDNRDIYAFNITKEYTLNKQLEEKKEKMEENNQKLQRLIENMEDLRRREESERLKNRFHDILGQRLSILHQYLIHDNKEIDEIKFMIRKMFTDIEDEKEPVENLNNLIKIYDKTGVHIIVNGKLPDDEKVAKTFFEIIREAVTNAIRHADSNKITVTIKETIINTQMEIINNGKKPNEFIKENEGIQGMRRKVREIKGRIFIDTNDVFRIRVIVDKLT